MTPMTDLADRIEALTGPNFAIEQEIGRFMNPNATRMSVFPPYTASIDAAMTLVPEAYAVVSIRETTENEQEEYTGSERLPLWSSTLVRRDCTGYKNRKKFAVAFQHGDGTTPAIALCVAALKARNLP